MNERTDGQEGWEGRVRLRRSSASKAAGILLKPLKKIQNSLLRRSDSRIFENNADPRRPSSFDPPAELPGQTPAPRLAVNWVKDGCGRDCALSCVVGSSVGVRRY